MIQVKFNICNNNLTITKKIQFCKNHEKNFEIIYGIAKEIIERKQKRELEQFMIICCHHIVKEIRERKIPGIIEDNLLVELSKQGDILKTLKEIKTINIEAKVDNFPKKNICFSSKKRILHLF
ncbi:hypothetical protein [Nitrosopumilus sp. S4]